MTLAEFKSWFAGFTETMKSVPTEKQWKRIIARVKEIDGVAVTERVFIDRYWSAPRPYWIPYWGYATSGTIGGVLNTPNGPICTNLNTKDDGHQVYNSTTAMLSLGQAEYQSLTS